MDTNEHLSKDPVAFYQWCLGQVRSFMEWEPEATRLDSIRNIVSTKTRLSPVQQRRVPVQNHRPKEEENGQRVSKWGPPRTRFEWLKSKSTKHSVRRCPLCAPGKAEALLRNRISNHEGYSPEAPKKKETSLVKEKGDFTLPWMEYYCM